MVEGQSNGSQQLREWTVFKRNTQITSVPSVKSTAFVEAAVSGLCLCWVSVCALISTALFSFNLTAHQTVLVRSPVRPAVSIFRVPMCTPI